MMSADREPDDRKGAAPELPAEADEADGKPRDAQDLAARLDEAPPGDVKG